MADAKKTYEIIAKMKNNISPNLKLIGRSFSWMTAKAKAALRGLTKMVFNLKTGLLGLSAVLGANMFIRPAADIENYRAQLTAIYGDAKKAAVALHEMRKFAAESPLETKDVIEAFKVLESVGVESAETVVKKLGNVAVIFKREVADISNAFIGLNKRTLRQLGVEVDRQGKSIIIAAGKGPKRMVVEIEKANKTTIQLNKEIRNSLLDIWTKQFPNAMDLMKNNFDAAVAVFKSKIFELTADIGKKYLPKLTEFFNKLSDMITEHHNEIVALFTSLPDIWDIVVERLMSKLESGKKSIKKGFWNWLMRPLTMWGEMKGFEGKTINQRIKEMLAQSDKKKGWTYSVHIRSKDEVPLMDLINAKIKERAELINKENILLEEKYKKAQQELKIAADITNEVEKKLSLYAQFKEGFVGTLFGHEGKEEGQSIDGLIDKFSDLEEQGKLAAHNLAYGIKDSLGTAFKDLIRQTKSVEEVFINFGNRILDVFAQIAAEFAAQQITAAVFKGFAGLSGLGFANGGVMPGTFRAFAGGGVSDGPTLGLIGEGKYKNEAVVPLPDGRSIPVDLKGNQGQGAINNVIVIQAIDGQGVMRIMPQVEAFLINSINTRSPLRETIKKNV